jgi:hypothetical protein
MTTSRAAFCLAALLVPGLAFADAKDKPDADKAPGVLAASDDFERQDLGEKWQQARGEWKIQNGTLVGKELKSDEHAAVLAYQHPNHNSAIEFSFKLDGIDSFNLSYNKKRGHLFRVVVSPRGLTVRLDKDKKDPNSRALQLAAAQATFNKGEWYTMRVTLQGDKATITTSNGVTLQATHPDLNQPKPNYRFVMRGANLVLDNVKVWDLK